MAEDRFEGALWRFEMTNRAHPNFKLKGHFRVAEHVLYQGFTPDDRKMSKKVGSNHPNGAKTHFEVSDFRVFAPDSRQPIYIKGSARLSLVKVGEWEGMFTDGRGSNWDYHAFRIQE